MRTAMAATPTVRPSPEAASTLSVIIPTLNEIGHIGRTLHALRRRARQPDLLQVIVADGGSRDGTATAARRSGARVIVTGKAGRALQMNSGAAEASGEVFYFLHADTIPPPGFDASIRRLLRRHQAGCFRLHFDRPSPLLNFYGWCTRLDIDAFRFGDQSLFVKRRAFAAAGGYCEDHILLEGHDMVRRLKRKYPFAISAQNVVTSARKYKKNGTIRLQFLYGLIFFLYKCDLAQSELYSLYKRYLYAS